MDSNTEPGTLDSADALGDSLDENLPEDSFDIVGHSLTEISFSSKTSLNDLGESLNMLSISGDSIHTEPIPGFDSVTLGWKDGIQSRMMCSEYDPYDFSDTEFQNNSEVDASKRRITSTPKKTKRSNRSLNQVPIDITHSVGENFQDQDEDLQDQNSFSQQNILESFDFHSISHVLETEDVTSAFQGLSVNPSNKMLNKALSTAFFCKLQHHRCKKLCLKDLSLPFIRSARYRVWTKDYEGRVEWFSDKYAESENKDGDIMFPSEGGNKICGKCFRLLYRLDKNFYCKLMKKNKYGAIAAGYRNGRSATSVTETAISWLEDYSKFHGDRMPDRNIIMLSYKTRKIDVFSLYKNEQVEEMEDFVSRSKFYEIWTSKFDYLKIKQTNSFSKCAVCTSLERQLEGTREQSERKHIKSLIQEHQRRQMQERKYYYEKRNKAVKYKEQYMSLIIDGMDQVKTNLPHFTGRCSKSLDMQYLLQTHLQGIINHGQNRFAKYVDLNEYCHDSNMVMNTILKEIHEASLLMGNKLSEVLFLQADNCYRENKNKYMLGFCELLVWKKVFKEVHLSFLLVGHTHEDIDAGFSQIAEKLRRNDAPTLPSLMELIPNTKRLNGLFDIKQWLTPCLNKISHHTHPHHFKFSQDIDGKVLTQYKGSCSKSWLNFPINILHTLPNGVPLLIEPPNFQNMNLDQLSKNIERSRFLFLDTKDELQFRWWKKFISNLRELKTSIHKRKLYSKINASWLLPLLPQQKEKEIEPVPALLEQLTEMVDKEFDEPLESVIKDQTRCSSEFFKKVRISPAVLSNSKGRINSCPIRGHHAGGHIRGRGRGKGRGKGRGRGRVH